MMNSSASAVASPVAIIGLDVELVELVLLDPQFTCAGVIDSRDTGSVLGAPWLGSDGAWSTLMSDCPELRVIIGVDVPSLREQLAMHYGVQAVIGIRARGSVISPFASVCASAIVQCGVKVNANASIGYCCKLNHDAVIHHDCYVGDFSTLSPGARLLGGVRLGKGVFVGAGAVVLPGVTVGVGATIGAGAVVTRDVPPGFVVAGCPAKPINRTG